MITRIEATNYRCFERLDVDLGELRVIVGANGAGKTTFLDIPLLLGELLTAKHIGTVFLQSAGLRGARASTLGELIYQGRGEWFSFAVEARLPERVARDLLEGATKTVYADPELWPKYIRYELRLQIFNGRTLQVQNEYLFTYPEQHKPARAGEEGAARLHGEFEPHKTWNVILEREYGSETQYRVETKSRAKPKSADVAPELLALPRVQFEGVDEFPASRWLLDLLTEHGVFFEPNWADLRTASPPGLPERVVADGRNLPWLALDLKESDPDRFESWKEHVAVALPQVTDINAVEREEDHHAYFRVTYNHAHQVTSSGLSEGTLRILALTLIPYLPEPPRLLIVEEPENGIHPRAIEAVLQSLSSVYDSQVLLSSHSPIVVAQTPVEQILAARLDDGGGVTIVPGAKHPRLAEWKGQLDLGSLFAAGVLG